MFLPLSIYEIRQRRSVRLFDRRFDGFYVRGNNMGIWECEYGKFLAHVLLETCGIQPQIQIQLGRS